MIFPPPVIPGRGLFAATGQIWATGRTEFVMQWRRAGLWLAAGGCTALLLLLTAQGAIYFANLPLDSWYATYTPVELEHVLLYNTTANGSLFLGIVIALLVVDRLKRDQQLSMAELQQATPQGHVPYVLGKFLGNYVAILIPMFLCYLLCAVLAVLLGWSVMVIPKFLLAFLLVFVPASFATVGLTLLLTSFLPVRIVQIGFPLLWFYLNIGIGWRGLAASIFNVGGLYVYPVFFPVPPFRLSVLPVETSLDMALLNITALLLSGIVSVILMYGSLVFQQNRKERM